MYLGRVVRNDQVCPEISKVEAVQRWPVLATKKQVCASCVLWGASTSSFIIVAAPLMDLPKTFAPNIIT